ncbi:hypothetical protein [uncultured Anaerovibrio sp.]|uniref:hypothetical protein n=1 Tax=uncultured Anaerovibrio sp. TaxID=361586 RepID=UPI002604DA83|nr:hypothetical protein [uncultured Anaerovibrio sp.]
MRMTRRLFFSIMAFMLTVVSALMVPSYSQASILSTVNGATCWHGDSQYPVWDTGSSFGSIFDVHTAYINYEDDKILNIVVKGNGISYKHDNLTGESSSHNIVENKTTGRVTINGKEPPPSSQGMFYPAYALVKDYAIRVSGAVNYNTARVGSDIEFTGIKQVLSIDNYSGIIDNCSGDLNGSVFRLGREEVELKPTLIYKQEYGVKKIGGGYIKLLSLDNGQDYLSFPLQNNGSVKASVVSTASDRVFLLIQTYQGSANGSNVCDGMWLVGKHGDKYVTYATKATLDQAGLLYDDIESQINDGKLEIIGVGRAYGNGMGDKYSGRRYRIIGKGYGTVGSVYLRWDSNANWIGFQLVNVG